MSMAATLLFHGRVAGDGRLVEADPPLLALQQAAGGALNAPFVVPTLARLVQLAGRIGTPIARPVTVAGADGARAFWVRLTPGVDGIRLTLAERESAPQPNIVDRDALAAHAALAGSEGWLWQVDRHLRIRHFESEALPGGHPRPRIGEALADFFRLEDARSGAGHLPMLSAVAAARPFSGQAAQPRLSGRWRYELAGVPLFDAAGHLSGYRGRATPTGAGDDDDLAEPLSDRGFEQRLDLALRQPLGRIVANASSISAQIEGPLRADYVAYATEIAEAGRHLIALVDDLGDLRAIERPDFRTTREQVDIADLARRAAGLLKLRAAERRIAIRVPAETEVLGAAGEYRRVLQILVNLIGNAVRYSPDGSEVWVRVVGNPGSGTVSAVVADQGRGIDPADHERIFARFERLEPGDETGGSGLGLYISRQLARAMGGDIAVDSARGQGARFTLTLPAWS